MPYNFDKVVPRKGTNCLKHDFNEARFGRKDVLSMWVADMDFEAPYFILNAINERAKHPVFGYTISPGTLYTSIINWVENNHGWKVKKDWLTFSTGVVPSLHFCVLALTQPGDRVIVQPPVYYPFFSAIKDHKREIQYNPLVIKDGKYAIDFENLEKNTDKKTKLLFLCSPHNPGGRVWPKEELLKLASFCLQRGIIIISDEVHADMVYKPAVHVPFATLGHDISQHTVTLMAPSKTFNLAGLASSFIITENPVLRQKIAEYLDLTQVNSLNIFGMAVTEAAFTYGHDWLNALMTYLGTNYLFLEKYFRQHAPMLTLMQPEATYLAWIDFSSLPLKGRELKNFIIREAGLGLNDGPMFGPGGEGFQRLNFACPRETLEKGLEQLAGAIQKHF